MESNKKQDNKLTNTQFSLRFAGAIAGVIALLAIVGKSGVESDIRRYEADKSKYEEARDALEYKIKGDSAYIKTYRDYANISDARSEDSTSYTEEQENKAWARFEEVEDSLKRIYNPKIEGFAEEIKKYDDKIKYLKEINQKKR